jgi:hypothetical protein
MPDRVDRSGIALGALLVVTAIGLSIVAGIAILHFDEAPLSKAAEAAEAGRPPRIAGPVTLQPNPASDIDEYREQKRRMLEAYAWVDRERGVVRIPIERAMALLAPDGAAGARR